MTRAQDRLAQAEQQLAELLEERRTTLALHDRVAALRALPAQALALAGMDVAFVGHMEDADAMVLRNLAGVRTGLLQDLVVRSGLGLGGTAMKTGRPVDVSHYAQASTITHHFDREVLGEGIAAVMAVPVSYEGELLGVAYGCLRRPAEFGDVQRAEMERLARRAGAQVHVARQVSLQSEAAVQEERNRLAVELHDNLGAMLFSIGAEVRDLHGDPDVSPDLAARLERISGQLSEAGSALRESLTSLRTGAPGSSLPAALRSDCRAFEARSRVRARAVLLGELPELDEHRTAALSAAVREGLLNVEKHASGVQSVVVTAVAGDDGVLVAVTDDGTGIGSGDGHGMGLAAARDRLEQVGGRLTCFADEDGGWTVRAWVPHP